MAIIKRAKNLIVNIKNEYRHFSGSYECVSDEVQIIATEGNLTLTSAKKIAVKKGSDNTTAKSAVEQNKNGVKGGNSDNYKKINGHFYKTDGTFLGKEYSKDFTGDVNDVYICDPDFIRPELSDNNWVYKAIQNLGPIKAKDRVYENVKKLTIKGVDIKNDTFLRIAGLAYSEVGYNSEAIKRIPYIIMNRSIQNNGEDFHRGESIDDTIREIRGRYYPEWSYFNHNDVYKTFLGYDTKHKAKKGDVFDYDRNAFGRNSLVITQKKLAKLAIEYTIKAFYYLNEEPSRRNDLSEEAIGWHGTDILTATGETRKNLERDLYIADDLKKGTKFNSWTNPNPNKSWIYIGFKIYKGSGNFGPTVFYKKIKK